MGRRGMRTEKMTGVSLRGTVKKREKESVYLKLDIDGAERKALHPYPWIPPHRKRHAYCMPQEGDGGIPLLSRGRRKVIYSQ